MKKIGKHIIFQLFKSVIEIQITPEDFRNHNIRDIFEHQIYMMPDICEVYDSCFERISRNSKWYHTEYVLHERAKKMTISFLKIINEKKDIELVG
jgi:hypothetical protein